MRAVCAILKGTPCPSSAPASGSYSSHGSQGRARWRFLKAAKGRTAHATAGQPLVVYFEHRKIPGHQQKVTPRVTMTQNFHQCSILTLLLSCCTCYRLVQLQLTTENPEDALEGRTLRRDPNIQVCHSTCNKQADGCQERCGGDAKPNSCSMKPSQTRRTVASSQHFTR